MRHRCSFNAADFATVGAVTVVVASSRKRDVDDVESFALRALRRDSSIAGYCICSFGWRSDVIVSSVAAYSQDASMMHISISQVYCLRTLGLSLGPELPPGATSEGSAALAGCFEMHLGLQSSKIQDVQSSAI